MQRRYSWAWLGLVFAAAVQAEVKPNTLCTEGMVLQQKQTVNLWGKADPGEKVTVEFRGMKAAAAADARGDWLVKIPSGDAGGPFPLSIQGSNTIDYKDVYVGEVWICSGQSNMEWTVGSSGPEDLKSATEVPRNPLLRCFKVEKNAQVAPVHDVKGSWVVASPEVVKTFTSAGYFFGRHLQANLKVPVGLISTNWGGTRAEAWTSKATLEKFPVYKNDLSPVEKAQANTASALYNGMIYPILNYGIKGAIWYQGESNAGKAYQYRELFPTMITNWREDFKQGDFPFYFVQLAPFTPVKKDPGESNWAELREAQFMTLKLKNTGMAVITDLGSEYDIHPTPKQPVGERLALAARALTYGQRIEYSGPTPAGLKIEGNKAILSFDHASGGLIAKELVPTMGRKNKQGVEGFAWRVKEGTGAKLTGFTIAGVDKKFHHASAEIVGNTVVVHSEQVAEPLHVRYGWADHPLANLFNKEGLPATPFRTDNFPGITQPK